MERAYSQTRASMAVAKASLLAMLRSPTSVVFSVLFPLIFIVVFGAMVDNNIPHLVLGYGPRCDTAGPIFRGLRHVPTLELKRYESFSQMQEILSKGKLAAAVDIQLDSAAAMAAVWGSMAGSRISGPLYKVRWITSHSSAQQGAFALSAFRELLAQMDRQAFPKNSSLEKVQEEVLPGRVYRQIDFILPGQLGFSLLMAGVFGSAFLFYSLRQNLVLKRIFATPIRPAALILGELLSRLCFQVLGFVVMVGVGYLAFDFTLVHGLYTFLEMLVFSLLGLIIFMGMGFIISSFLQNESSIAPVANTLTLPQILLCGLFFPIENYPQWLQAFCNLLPLTFFVEGLRKIAFEGVHFWQMPHQVLGLTVWAAVIAWLTVRLFRWE